MCFSGVRVLNLSSRTDEGCATAPERPTVLSFMSVPPRMEHSRRPVVGDQSVQVRALMGLCGLTVATGVQNGSEGQCKQVYCDGFRD